MNLFNDYQFQFRLSESPYGEKSYKSKTNLSNFMFDSE